MALPTFNTKSPTIKRILKEASELQSRPDPTLHAAPLDTNLFEWHFTLRGPPSTPYATGAYHGRIILPPTYPLRPPSFRFLTPSGRFEVNREICLSISGHHEETWQPAWGIRTALWALRAFMEGDAKGQVGGLDMGEGERKRLAEESKSWRCLGCGGRTNDTVLREEGGSGEENATDAGGKKGGEVQVPEELRFGFKDQMGGNAAAAEKKDKGKQKEEVPPPPPPAPAPAAAVPAANAIGNAVGQPVAAPAGPALSLQVPMQPRAPVAAMANPRLTQDGVPAWIDKAITGVVAALALLIFKKILL